MACQQFKLADYGPGTEIDLTLDPMTVPPTNRGVPEAVEIVADPGEFVMNYRCWLDAENVTRTFTRLSHGDSFEGGKITKIIVDGTTIVGVRVRWL